MQIIKNIYYWSKEKRIFTIFIGFFWQHTIFIDSSNNSFRFGFIQMRVYHPQRVKRKEERHIAEMVSRGLTARFHTRNLSPSVITFYTIFIFAFSIFLFLFYVKNFIADEDQSHPLFSHQSLPQQVCRYSFFSFRCFSEIQSNQILGIRNEFTCFFVDYAIWFTLLFEIQIWYWFSVDNLLVKSS